MENSNFVFWMCVRVCVRALARAYLDAIRSIFGTGYWQCRCLIYTKRERHTYTDRWRERGGHQVHFWRRLLAMAMPRIYKGGETHIQREKEREREREREYLGAIFGGGYCHGVHGRR